MIISNICIKFNIIEINSKKFRYSTKSILHIGDVMWTASYNYLNNSRLSVGVFIPQFLKQTNIYLIKTHDH